MPHSRKLPSSYSSLLPITACRVSYGLPVKKEAYRWAAAGQTGQWSRRGCPNLFQGGPESRFQGFGQELNKTHRVCIQNGLAAGQSAPAHRGVQGSKEFVFGVEPGPGEGI